jgi:hypothetical protein
VCSKSESHVYHAYKTLGLITSGDTQKNSLLPAATDNFYAEYIYTHQSCQRVIGSGRVKILDNSVGSGRVGSKVLRICFLSS